MASTNSSRTGVVYTFYSYKGGVGRSMALANVAELLYQIGLNVLMIDWDLEAPGLEHYFPVDNKQALEQRGVIDLLLSYKEQLIKEVPPDQEEALLLEAPDEYLINIYPNEKSIGRLWLLTAGRRAGENDFAAYARAVREFDWKDFYDNWEGELYLDWLRKQFERIADVVLIDSRTGVTEIGGVTTYQFADTVVLLCGTNKQNLDGALRMAKNFLRPLVQERRSDRPLQTLLVPARVEDRSETQRTNAFRADFLKSFADEPYTPKLLTSDDQFLWKLKIPYVGLYAFDEKVAVREQGSLRHVDMVEAYATLVRTLALMAPEDSLARGKLLRALKHLPQIVREGKPRLLPAGDGDVGAERETQSGEISEMPLERIMSEIGLAAQPFVRPPCPYPGMVPYRTEDARYFHGRATEVGQMVQRLERDNLLLVTGPSSSGKSSVVFAGLVPAMPRGTKGSNSVEILTMRPGDHPLETLRNLLEAGAQLNISIAIAAWLAKHAPGQRLVLIIDQLEEIFTVPERAEREEFLDVLKELLASPSEKCKVVLVLRADYYADLLASNLWPYIRQVGSIEITRLVGSALREAIQAPANAVGVQIEASLLERLLADAAEEPGSMPLLQEALVLLWAKMERRQLTLASYEELGGKNSGGLASAIALLADSSIARLSYEQQAVARRIFLRLTQAREGRASIPRQSSLEALRSCGEDSELFDATLSELAHDRLLILSGTGSNSMQKSVDLAHEGLIHNWPTMQEWVTKFQVGEQVRRRFEERASTWVEKGGGTGGLLDEVELREVEKWLESPDAEALGYTRNLLDYVAASKRRVRSRRLLVWLSTAALVVYTVSILWMVFIDSTWLQELLSLLYK